MIRSTGSIHITQKEATILCVNLRSLQNALIDQILVRNNILFVYHTPILIISKQLVYYDSNILGGNSLMFSIVLNLLKNHFKMNFPSSYVVIFGFILLASSRRD